jgi:hypothetical protein
MHLSGHSTLLLHPLLGCLWPPARLLISRHLLRILSGRSVTAMSHPSSASRQLRHGLHDFIPLGLL